MESTLEKKFQKIELQLLFYALLYCDEKEIEQAMEKYTSSQENMSSFLEIFLESVAEEEISKSEQKCYNFMIDYMKQSNCFTFPLSLQLKFLVESKKVIEAQPEIGDFYIGLYQLFYKLYHFQIDDVDENLNSVYKDLLIDPNFLDYIVTLDTKFPHFMDLPWIAQKICFLMKARLTLLKSESKEEYTKISIWVSDTFSFEETYHTADVEEIKDNDIGYMDMYAVFSGQGNQKVRGFH